MNQGVDRGCRRGEGASLLRAASLSAARRQPRELSPPLAGPAAAPRGLPSVLARAGLPGRSIHPDRRLRDVPGGQARPALARGAGDRHRLQRDQRPLHRGAQAQVRPRQSRGPSAADRARRRAGDDASIRSSAPACSIISPDPDAGLAALRDVLRPDGAMHLMVYAPHGRTGIYMLQEFCRRLGIRATDDGIAISSPRSARCRPDTRWGRCCARRRTSGSRRRSPTRCCTRRTAPIRCRSCSSSSRTAGLTFGRWVRQAPYSPRCGVMARIPQAARLAALPLAEQYAAVELFRGTMVRHSVVVYRDDGPGGRRGSQLRRRRLARATCRSACPTRSASRSGCRPARRPC